MSHAVLVNDGLLLLVIASAVLLAVFVAAVIRAPSEGAGPPGRHAGGTGPDGDPGYQPRHAAAGGPPWDPAPKPPGTGRDRPG